MKRIWKDYFSFSKKERTAILLLLALMIVFIILPYFFSVREDVPVISDDIKNFITNNNSSSPARDAGNKTLVDTVSDNHPRATIITPFFFDPNTLNEQGWIRLGLSPRTAATILRYRNKGGHFRSAEDIRKIWGITPQQATMLIPYVRMEATTNVYQKNPIPVKNFPAKKYQPVDINKASLEEWQSLPGIGNVLAERIIRYRERMHGFTDPSQVKKVYGITDTVFGSLLPFLYTDTATMEKLDLNTVSQYTLAERTGISRETAKAIIISRQQAGNYRSVADLKRIVFINDSILAMIRPFVTVR